MPTERLLTLPDEPARLGQPPGWDRERRATAVLLLAAMLPLVPHLPHLPGWAVGVVCGALIWRWLVLLGGRPLPSRWLLTGLTLLMLAAVWREYGSVFSRDAGMALLCLFATLKLLELRARRDVFVAIFIGFFLLLASYFHGQSLAMGGFSALALALLILAWMNMHYGVEAPPAALRIRAMLWLMLQALPLAVVLFFLFPRLHSPLWQVAGGGGASTGMSDTMSPGSISQLAGSDATAFRVQFDDEPPRMARLYWRGGVLGHYDGRTWTAQTEWLSERPDPAPDLRQRAQAHGYKVMLEPHGQRWLFLLETPLSVRMPAGMPAWRSPELVWQTLDTVDQRIEFFARSLPDARFGRQETSLSRQDWLQLPPGFNPRTLTHASALRERFPAGSRAADARLVQHVLEWIGSEQFAYTMAPPLQGRHAVDELLFDTRRGFCEHYAGAFVVLMRALDIPARVVIGYHGGEVNPFDGLMTVRQSDAHAWAEVWLEGVGWYRIDPTAAIAPERVERGAAASTAGERSFAGLPMRPPEWLRQLRHRMEAVSSAWNSTVINWNAGSQRSLLEGLGWSSPDLRALLGTLLIATLLASGAVAIILLRRRSHRDPLAMAMHELRQRLRRAGIAVEDSDAASTILLRVQQQGHDATHIGALRAWLDRYNALRYGVVHTAGSSRSAGRRRGLRRIFRTAGRRAPDAPSSAPGSSPPSAAYRSACLELQRSLRHLKLNSLASDRPHS